MDPISAFILGALSAAATLLTIQAYGRRKVRKALAAQPARQSEPVANRQEVGEMRRRVEVLERIVTEQPRRLEQEIEQLRQA